jgi:hypothetical protein
LAKLFRGAKIGISHKGTKGEGRIGGKLKSGGTESINSLKKIYIKNFNFNK